MIREQLLFETDAAKYIAVIKQEYIPITGGINTDISLRTELYPTQAERREMARRSFEGFLEALRGH